MLKHRSRPRHDEDDTDEDTEDKDKKDKDGDVSYNFLGAHLNPLANLLSGFDQEQQQQQQGTEGETDPELLESMAGMSIEEKAARQALKESKEVDEGINQIHYLFEAGELDGIE